MCINNFIPTHYAKRPSLKYMVNQLKAMLKE